MGIQESINPVPAGSANFVQPVASVDKFYCDVARHRNSTVSETGFTIMTTSANRDFYLTGMNIALVKDATCDVADGSGKIAVVIGGASVDLCALPTLTLTAQNVATSQTFNPPIKIDRNSNINANKGTFTAGKYILSTAIYGFYL